LLSNTFALGQSTFTGGSGTLSFGSLTAATFGGLSGNSNLALSNTSSAAVALTVGANGESTSYAGILSGGAGSSLTKQGAGQLTLTGNNTFTGLTTVEQGALAVNGGLAGGLSVLAGATLMGSGTIGGDATIAGIHAPGNSPGIETFASNLTYLTGASVIWDLQANTADAGLRGIAYDGINVGGNLTFSGSTTLSLDFGGLGTGSVAWSNAFWDVAQQWVLYSVGGSTTGTSNFTLLSNTNSWIDSAGVAFSSSSRKDNKFEVVQEGNNVLLQYVIVPEPAAVTLALIGIAAAAYAARRRRS
jgi:autotransporter-associated beta strand protein